ncbi:MAG: type I glutamate--ammonia ligase [Methanomassiliicoccales archaeon]|nr:type I glutamate--ammonia ligase [Methanomassiliicoccales archaeon]
MVPADEADQQEELLRHVSENNVKFIEMQFSDLLGRVKSVSIPARRLESVLEEGVYIDGSSILGYSTVDESDMRARPIPDSYLTYPWTVGGDAKTGRLLCTICDASILDGEEKRFLGDPRQILERQLMRAKRLGWTYQTGPEIEFFLFKMDADGVPQRRPSDKGGYFDLMPLDKGEVVRKDIMSTFDRMGFDVEASHHEVAPGQQEIAMRYSEALSIADRMMTMKLGIRTIAKQHGMHATFMPKPLEDMYGSAMHVHQSLVDEQGNNVFYDQDGEFGLSDVALRFIGGLLKHAKETCAIFTSHINSYRRLVPGYEAPFCITWANKNRSSLIRVPAGRGAKTRVEHRNPDPAGNPYLQFAVMLAAGLDGIENDIYPGPPFEKNTFKMSRKDIELHNIETLPENLGEALSNMRKSQLIKDTLGEHTFESFLHVKEMEWDRFRRHVTSFELEGYLESV